MQEGRQLERRGKFGKQEEMELVGNLALLVLFRFFSNICTLLEFASQTPLKWWTYLTLLLATVAGTNIPANDPQGITVNTMWLGEIQAQ